MKANYKKILMILPLMPLMMANSPARSYSWEQPNYDDFEINLVSKEETDLTSYGRRFYYTFQLKNNGEGYIYDLVYRSSDELYDYLPISFMEDADIVFPSIVLAPHHEYTFSFYDNDIDFSDKMFSSFAYTEFVPNEEIEGSKTTRIIDESIYETDIYLECTIQNENTNKYFYVAIININYDGVDYYVPSSSHYYSDDSRGFMVSSYGRLDRSKIIFPDDNCVIARRLNRGYVEPTFSILALGIAVGSVALIVGIYSAIYFPIKAKKGKKQ